MTTKEKYGWCVKISGFDDDYISAYCHFKKDAEKMIEGNERWQQVVFWKDALRDFEVDNLHDLLVEGASDDN